MKKLIKYISLFLLLVLISAMILAYQLAPVATGYSAKYLCSQVFIAGQHPEKVMEYYVKPINPLFGMVTYQINREERTVTARMFGFLRPTTALYRDHCGCTLMVDTDRATLQAQVADLDISLPQRPDTLWPAGNAYDPSTVPANVDLQALNERLEEEFVETADDPDDYDQTLALVVAYQDRIIAEQYAEGVTDTTPLLSWSVSKSVTNALYGVWVQQQQFDIYQPAPVQVWAGDKRRSITVDQLLRMESGLAFEEAYAPFTDAVSMLYESSDMSAFAAKSPLVAEPGTVWSYSSGTTNILAGILFDQVGGNLVSMREFAYRELFYKLGMRSAIFEHDVSGAFVGSSYFHASPKDLLRLALLYKNDGIWEGERILPEGWVDYSLTPTPHAPDACYGAQIWLNAGAPGPESLLPSLPKDAFMFEGYQDQWFVVIPSKDLMVARFGVTNHPNWSADQLILDILATIDYSQE